MCLRLLPVWLIWTLTNYKETTFLVVAMFQDHAGYIGPLNKSIFDAGCPYQTSYTVYTMSSCLALCDTDETCTVAQLHHANNDCELLQCPYPIPNPTQAAIGYTSYYKKSGYFGPTELIWSEDDCRPFNTFTKTTSSFSCFLKCTEQPVCSAVVYNSVRRTCTLLECPYPIPKPTRKFKSFMGFYKEPGYFGPITNHWSDSDCMTINSHSLSESVEECKERCDNRHGCTAINYRMDSESGTCTMKECPLSIPQPTGNRYNTVGYYKYPGCLSSQFECDSGKCISGVYKCDSIDHCYDGSDEIYCVCEKHQFECGNAVCISSQMRCNGNDDCGDGSDEKHCACPLSQFECDNTVCIFDFMVCNGNDDCGDGSDEKECRCPENKFNCHNGICIKVYMKCDGNDDCGDGSDERDCVCAKNRDQCNNGVCIKKYMICNVKDDCGDGSDEGICRCPVGQFQCNNNICIENYFLCDGYDDCGDLSDEEHCSYCNPKMFTCRNDGNCISRHKVCDSYRDCLDSSDEGAMCSGRPFWCPGDFKWYRNACFRMYENTTSWIWAESNCRSSEATLLQQEDVNDLINLREYIHQHVQGSTYELWIAKREGDDNRYVCPYMTKYSTRKGYCGTPRRYACLIAG